MIEASRYTESLTVTDDSVTMAQFLLHKTHTHQGEEGGTENCLGIAPGSGRAKDGRSETQLAAEFVAFVGATGLGCAV